MSHLASFAPAVKERIGNCNTLFFCGSYIAEEGTSQVIFDEEPGRFSLGRTVERLERFKPLKYS
jgi:hypothetical protein